MQPNASAGPSPLSWDTNNIPELVLEPHREDRHITRTAFWTQVAISRPGEGSPVAVQHTPVPEGGVSVVRCTVCGSRVEYLVDLRSLRHAGEAALDVALTLSNQRFGTLVSDMLVTHQHCAEPKVLPVAPDVLEFAQAMELTARARLRAGEPIGKVLFLLRASGAVHRLPVQDALSYRQEESLQGESLQDVAHREVAQRLTAARDTLRSSNDPLAAAVFIAHFWTSLQDEALIVTVVTPSVGRIAVAAIGRPKSLGKQARRARPGAVAPLEWRPLAGPHLLTDGLFARDPVLPFCAEDRRIQVVR
jgi:hypothetical protein